MTKIPAISEAELQSYVDGRLSASRRVEVEAYLQSHPEVAERLRAYEEQNRLLHDLFDPVLQESVPERLTTTPARAKHPARWLRVAAMSAWLLIGGITGFLLRGTMTDTLVATEPFTERAALAHVVYAAEMLHPVEVGADQKAHLVKWLSKRLGHPLRTPDLRQFGYELVGGRLLPGDKGVAAQFMYQTQAGSRMTLYVSIKDKGTAQTAFRIEERDGQQLMYWVDDKLSFALVGERNRGRLTDIARITYQAMSY